MFTMPSKKRKYNARFPAGRIKKIMQTDEEVGKVAQAVPIIIYPIPPTPRTLELFVESLLSKAMQVTLSRNAKTLSPSHVKQCILAESRFDFLKDLVKSIPDVSAAEEKELMSAESSPNSSRFSDTSCPPPKVLREDSTSSSSSDVRTQSTQTSRVANDDITSKSNLTKPETITSSTIAIDLTKKLTEERIAKKVVSANFYQETLLTNDDKIKPSVIQLNPTYSTSQPSTSTTLNAQNNLPLKKIKLLSPVPKSLKQPVFHIDLSTMNNNSVKPQTPIINIDFSKSFVQPEIRVLDSPVPNLVPIKTQSNNLQRQISVTDEVKHVDSKVSALDDNYNSGNLEIDEDYDT